MTRALRTCATALLSLGLLAAGIAAAGSGEARPDVPNPHNQPDACATCHEVSDDDAVGAPKLGMQLCYDCHPNADMHPVNVEPVDTRVPSGWPLLDGAVVCATCHAEPACDADRSDVAPFLRGADPLKSRSAFCFQCHDATEYQRANPHRPATARDPSDPTCAACHSGAPIAGASVPDARLRFPEGDQGCVECHQRPVHQGVGPHLGQAPADHGLAPTGALSLDASGQIRCYTCHEVHGDGDAAPVRDHHGRLRDALVAHIAAEDWDPWVSEAVLSEAEEDDHGALLALPAADGSLCRACHGVGP